jgi:hypothetical protein
MLAKIALFYFGGGVATSTFVWVTRMNEVNRITEKAPEVRALLRKETSAFVATCGVFWPFAVAGKVGGLGHPKFETMKMNFKLEDKHYYKPAHGVFEEQAHVPEGKSVFDISQDR